MLQPSTSDNMEPSTFNPVQEEPSDKAVLGNEVLHREESHRLVLEGGAQRTAFRLRITMQRLEAAFNYEVSDAPPLGSISVQVRLGLGCNEQRFWAEVRAKMALDADPRPYPETLHCRTPTSSWQCILTRWSSPLASAMSLLSMLPYHRTTPTTRCRDLRQEGTGASTPGQENIVLGTLAMSAELQHQCKQHTK